MNDSSGKFALKYRALSEAILAAVSGAGIEVVAEKALNSAVIDLNLAAGALILWDGEGNVLAESVIAKIDENRQMLLDIEKTILATLRHEHKLNAAYLELGGERPRSVFSLPIETAERQYGALIGVTADDGKLDELITDEQHRFLRTLTALLTLIPENDEKARAIRSTVLDELAVGVNHMINNPLTPLIGTLDLLGKEKQDLPEDVRKKLAVIENSANQIKEVTARLMKAAEAPSADYINGKKMIDLSGREEIEKSDDEEDDDVKKT